MIADQPILWWTEACTPYELHDFSVRSCLFAGRTAFQEVIILDTHEYGKMLVIDGRTQSAEEDEYIYHEALVHPAMLTHSDPRSVLIIGGGEGAILREVLRYRSVERAVMVDIDRELVDLCQKFLPGWHAGAFQDQRVELLFADGKDYLDRAESSFDVILIDACDALEAGPALSLYTESSYRRVHERLNPKGLLAVQGMELCGVDSMDHVPVRDNLRRVFSVVKSYATFIPSFWTEWGFLIASDDHDPTALSRELLSERLSTRGPVGAEDLSATLLFYDPDAHCRMFSLPKDIKAALNHALPSEAALQP